MVVIDYLHVDISIIIANFYSRPVLLLFPLPLRLPLTKS